jgi:glycosyltransferase involved in cell wall biosynthesis
VTVDPPIRLLHLVHSYPPAFGGVEVSTRDLCEGLVARGGFEVDVLTTDVSSVAGFRDARSPRLPGAGTEERNGVRVHRYPVDTRWATLLRPMQRIAYGLGLPRNDKLRTLYDGPISPMMRKAVVTHPADVICAASFPLHHMQYAFARGPCGPPVVLVAAVHTNDPRGFARNSIIDLVNRSFATVAHTRHEHDWLVERGADRRRVVVIGHGLDPDVIHPTPGALRRRLGIGARDFVIAFLGQHAPHKGIGTIVRAFPKALALRSDSWLVIGGARTSFTAELERTVAALGPAGDRVRILPDLTEPEKADVLGDCDVFVSPSQRESFGITTLEAWAFGKPVIVGDAPSQHEVVDGGRTGLIVPFGDVEALLCALARTMDDTIRSRLGDAGRRCLVEQHGRRTVEDQYAALFQTAVGRSGDHATASM